MTFLLSEKSLSFWILFLFFIINIFFECVVRVKFVFIKINTHKFAYLIKIK